MPRRKHVWLLVFALSLLCFSKVDEGAASYSAVVSVYPRENTVKVGQAFTIDITVENISGLQGVDLCLKYPTSILNVTKVEEGAFLKNFGPTYIVKMEVNASYQLNQGRVWFVNVIYGDGFANGSGTLARITFNATNEGRGELDIFSLSPFKSDQVKLVTCQPTAISHTVIDGNVVVSADPNDPPPADPSPDPPPESSVLSPDVNGDKIVDILDLAIVARSYGHVNGDSRYDSKVDFNKNGSIDIQDVAVVAAKFRQTF